MKLQVTLVLVILSVLLLISGDAWAKRNRGQGHRRGDPDKRQTRDCQQTCFAHCLEGTTNTVDDFCDLRPSEMKTPESCPKDMNKIRDCQAECFCACSLCSSPRAGSGDRNRRNETSVEESDEKDKN